MRASGIGMWLISAAAVCTHCLVPVGEVEHDKTGGTGGGDASIGGSASGGVAGIPSSGGSGGLPPTGGQGGVPDAAAVDAVGPGGSGGSAGIVGGCAIPSDDFQDGQIAASWTTFGTGFFEQQGVLALSPPTTEPFAYTGVRTAVYDLRDCDVVVEVPAVLSYPTATSVYMTWKPEPDVTAARVRIEWQSGSLLSGLYSAPQTIPYSPNEHRWWRISASATTVHFWASPDGKSWIELWKVATPPELAAGSIELGAGTWDGKNAQLGEAHFDNFRLPPP